MSYLQGAETVPIMIVGTKKELSSEQRQISDAQGRSRAEELKCGWIEASAKYNEKVTEAFEGMIEEIIKVDPKDAIARRCSIM